MTIVRHAKSDWGNANLSDFDRTLNKRGKRDAPEMAKLFSKRVSDIEHVLSSPANRAKSTAMAFSKELNIPEQNIFFKDKLYHAHHETLFQIVNESDDAIGHFILFGHNPGLSDFSTLLTSEYINFPTCGILELELHVELWSEVSANTGSIINFDYPKKHAHLQ